MPLPQLNSTGELPEGVHQATMAELLAQFGRGTSQRQAVTARLRRIYALARSTGKLERLVLFGSYITAKAAPNDIDVVLVMRNDFDVSAYDEETRTLFDHPRAEVVFGASVFWVRPALLLLETLEKFIAHWQITRDQTRRGIVEVRE
jgi:predicted nucleotidyltransferase